MCVWRVLCMCPCVHVSVIPSRNWVSTQTSEPWQLAGPSGISTLNPAIVNASFHPRSWVEPVCRAGSDAAVSVRVCVCVCYS